MSLDIPPDIDEQLWIVRKSASERGFIEGSCHTFPGRFSVWFPSDGRSVCVSKFEVAESSPEADRWIEGFLHGCVPPPPEDSSQEAAWSKDRDEFLATGDWRQATDH